MSLIIGVLVPIILFLVTLPIQTTLFMMEQFVKQAENQVLGRGLLRKVGVKMPGAGEPGKGNSAERKLVAMQLKAIRMTMVALRGLIAFIRTIASSLIALVLSVSFTFLVMLVPFLGAGAAIVAILDATQGLTYSPIQVSSSDSGKNPGGPVNSSGIRYLQWPFKRWIADEGKPMSENGCGWCSLTHAMVVLNPEKCSTIDPEGWLDIMPMSVRNHWTGDDGMHWTAPKAWVDYLNSIGTYGKYELVLQGGSNALDVLEIGKKYLNQKNTTMVFTTSGGGFFTGGGHVMLMTYADDSYFNVTDSASTSFNHLKNSGKVEGIVDDASFNNYKFTVGMSDPVTGLPYNIVQCWVIQRIE